MLETGDMSRNAGNVFHFTVEISTCLLDMDRVRKCHLPLSCLEQTALNLLIAWVDKFQSDGGNS